MSGASVIEAMLLRWSESPTGRTVTFLLPDDGTQHPFKGLKTGPSYGQRVALSVALIADDETQRPAAEPEAKPAKERKRWDELPLSQQAAIRCNEPGFQQFMEAQDEKEAADNVRRYCGVTSRSSIEKNTTHGFAWLSLEQSYQHWLRNP